MARLGVGSEGGCLLVQRRLPRHSVFNNCFAAGAVAQIVNLFTRMRALTAFCGAELISGGNFDLHHRFQCPPGRVDRSDGRTNIPFGSGRNRFGRMAWW